MLDTDGKGLYLDGYGEENTLGIPVYTQICVLDALDMPRTVRNKIETRHVSGTNYTDIVVTCLLDYGEPEGQDAFDTATDTENLYVFDELGLKSYSPSGEGRLITHVIFHPVQKV